MRWSPYVIKVILHHHTMFAEFENCNAPIYKPTIEGLVRDGILERKLDGNLGTTELGAALVAMWCETPLPVRTYVDPRKTEAA
ncbi:hypothetical protein CN085_19555 [Sinorhizobium meliloti]|uniref:hypothetical protein n=1 Tax=Rhizobium meliloti TaxID=382 RepID=UPI000FD8C788|nr:hypothetical protein [Sinorhizobium meliloti]RVP13110.1 hypothetical protein CN085_19555 [Sinorhizobium meliloti]